MLEILLLHIAMLMSQGREVRPTTTPQPYICGSSCFTSRSGAHRADLKITSADSQLPGTSTSNGSGASSGSCVSGSSYTDSSTGYAWTCKNGAWVLGATSGVMSGSTGTITGTLLAVGGCDSGTATVTGATPGQNVIANTTDGSFLGGSFQVISNVSSSNTVTVNVCAVVAGTPASKAFNVKVIP